MATKKELLEQSQQALGDYFKLSALLFGDEAPTDINELKEDSPFYETARAITDDMGLEWDDMSHNDSNRVMLNMLAEYWALIQPVEKFKPVLSISFAKEE